MLIERIELRNESDITKLTPRSRSLRKKNFHSEKRAHSENKDLIPSGSQKLTKRISYGSASSTSCTVTSEEDSPVKDANKEKSKKKSKKRFQPPKGAVRLNSKYLICFDKGVQRYYFYESKSGRTTWKLNRIDENCKFLLMDQPTSEVHEWQISFHYKLKRYYFYDHDTCESVWVLPCHISHLRNRNIYKPKKVSAIEFAQEIRQRLHEDDDDLNSVKTNQRRSLMKPVYLDGVCNETESILFREESYEEMKIDEKEANFRNRLGFLKHYNSAPILEGMMAETTKFMKTKSFSDDESRWTLSDSEDESEDSD